MLKPLEELVLKLQPYLVDSRFLIMDKIKSIYGAETITLLLQLLDENSNPVRRGVCIALGELGDNRAVNPLIDLLRDDDRYIRESAGEALAKIGDNRAVEPFLDRIQHDAPLRLQFIKYLEKITTHEVFISTLVNLLTDVNSNGRDIIAYTLGAYNEEVVIELLLKSLKDSDPSVQCGSAWALSGLKESQAIQSLLELASSKNIEVAESALFSLGRIGDVQVLDTLLEIVQNKANQRGEKVRLVNAAIVALGNLKHKQATQVLLEIANDEKNKFRITAIKSLGFTKDSNTFETLVNLLGVDNLQIKGAAIDALAGLGDKRAIPYLENLFLFYQNILDESIETNEDESDFKFRELLEFSIMYLKEQF